MAVDQHTIRASALRALVSAADEEGVRTGALRDHLGIDESLYAAGDPTDRLVPLAVTDAAWIWAARLGPDDFALRVADRAGAKTFGVLTYLLAACDTVGTALSKLVQYYPVLSTGTRHQLRRHGDHVELEILLAGQRQRSPVVESFATAVAVALLRNETDGACRPHHVFFRQRTPDAGHWRAHERVLGAPVSFGAARCVARFGADAMDIPLRGADPELAQILEAHARQLLHANAPKPVCVTDRVRACLLDGVTQTEVVAARLALSPRSLRRHLAAAGTTLADLVAEQRSARALRLLAEPGVPVRDVATRLGYADSSSFRRAFRRWHGVSPRAYATAQATATERRR